MNALKAENDLAYESSQVDAPRANAAGVEVLRVRIALQASLDAPQLAALDNAERARAARFLRRADAVRHAAARAALREALGERLGRPAAALEFAVDESGRPRLAGDATNELDFNVSHSGEYALIAIASNRRVGIDIEAQRASFDWRAVARSVLGPNEAASIDGLHDSLRSAAFFDVWTAKEALVKALGTGIAVSGGLTGFSVFDGVGGAGRSPSVCLLEQAVAGEHNVGCYDALWCVAPPGYAACVAWSRAEGNRRR